MEYRPIGTFQKVVPIIEELKVQLENTKEMSPDAQKAINAIKRNAQSIYALADDPQRVWGAIADGIASIRGSRNDFEQVKLRSKFGPDGRKKVGYQINPEAQHISLREVSEQSNVGLVRRMGQLEKQFSKLPVQQNFKKSEHLNTIDVQKDQKIENFQNQRILTPNTTKYAVKVDASVMLREQVCESQLRLKAARFGAKIGQIIPSYDGSFYLPDKEKLNVIASP